MRSQYLIDSTEIKRPSQFKIERYKITEASRVASGQMMMELIAKKRKFYFTYDAIDSSDMNVILDALWENDKLFYNLEYIENNQRKSAIVYVGSIPSDLYRTDNSEWVWTNVTFNLIEQ